MRLEKAYLSYYRTGSSTRVDMGMSELTDLRQIFDESYSSGLSPELMQRCKALSQLLGRVTTETETNLDL